MDAITCIKERRSVRSYLDKKIDHKLFEEIIELTRYAPTWANTQTARWTIIDTKEIIEVIADEGVKGFSYNMDTLRKAPAVAILSYVQGKSGKLDKYDLETESTDKWEIFDAGIACQTFCLAAYAKGISTCIFGVIDEEHLGKIIDLPDGEKVASLIVCGYEAKHPEAPQRKEVAEIIRFLK